MKHIVVIGGGFAGINLVNGINGKGDFRVTVVDRNNYNFFPPLLYQIATGFLEVGNICYPFRKLFRRKKNINFHIGEFQKVIPAEKKVILSTGEISYDYLVFATGVTTNYFGMENIRQYALPMKTVPDALEIRNHILQQVELAVCETDDRRLKRLLTIVVVGGGPTGVEISGMLANMRKTILPKDYPELMARGYQPDIYLVDALDAVLKPMSLSSQKDTYESLREMGVEVRLNMQVKDYIDEGVNFSNGDRIETKTLIWAAGVAGTAFDGIPPDCYGRGKRLLTDEFNRVKGMEDIFAIGDNCLQSHEQKFAGGHPQMAQVAIQQGANLAGNFMLMQQGGNLKPFAYRDKGSMAIIGKNRAVVDMPGNKGHFSGFIAWFMWLFVHLMSLISYRNRITTLYNWTTGYLISDQSLRMIIRPEKK